MQFLCSVAILNPRVLVLFSYTEWLCLSSLERLESRRPSSKSTVFVSLSPPRMSRTLRKVGLLSLSRSGFVLDHYY